MSTKAGQVHDLLCYVSEDPVWQARLKHNEWFRTGDEIKLYRYMDALELFATGTQSETQLFGSDRLINYERKLRGHLYDHEEFVEDEQLAEAIERYYPLPPDFGHPDNKKAD